MNANECIEALTILLGCMDVSDSDEENKITTLRDLKPSSFSFVICETISYLQSLLNGGDNDDRRSGRD